MAPLKAKVRSDEALEWLDVMEKRLEWLNRSKNGFKLNIEELFHYAQFDMESHLLTEEFQLQGRDVSRRIKTFLLNLELKFFDVLIEHQKKSDLSPIKRWAEHITPNDTVLTFNYDTLVENALDEGKVAWTHGFDSENDSEKTVMAIPVYKMHGSLDWIVCHRDNVRDSWDLLFDEAEVITDQTKALPDCCLVRHENNVQMEKWVTDRDIQVIREQTFSSRTGMAGLGTYKPLHEIPGLGIVWRRGMQAVYEADCVVIVGFAMSDFDAMAQMQFALAARKRSEENRPLKVVVIDPFINKCSQKRFERVFEDITFITKYHEEFDWSELD
ncbi:MAG: hypothetical protein Tsb009_03730 [Planctomycetaceae bacterium]